MGRLIEVTIAYAVQETKLLPILGLRESYRILLVLHGSDKYGGDRARINSTSVDCTSLPRTMAIVRKMTNHTSDGQH